MQFIDQFSLLITDSLGGSVHDNAEFISKLKLALGWI